ncbi:MAG TPA: hypothetical protein PKO12_10760, partial [Holophaga sp.]|nr:hypothetical protein [Holophaga sp.]
QGPGAKDKVRVLKNLPAFRPWSLVFTQGHFWGLRVTDSEKHRLDLLKSADGRTWESAGTFTRQDSEHAPSLALPLGNGRVLGLHLNAVGEPAQASYLGMYAPNEVGVFRFMDAWPTELKVPLQKQIVNPGRQPYTVYNPDLNVLAATAYELLWGIITLPHHHVLLHATSGIAWVFDAEDGQLRRVAPLYPAMMDHLKDVSAIERVVLAWQPDYSGRILLASRTEDAVFQSRPLTAKAMKDLEPPPSLPMNSNPNSEAWEHYNTQMKAYRTRLRIAQGAGTRAFPEIRWWSFDPETGTYAAVPAPEGAPEVINGPEDLEGLILEATPDGLQRLARQPAETSAPVRPPAPTPSAHP